MLDMEVFAGPTLEAFTFYVEHCMVSDMGLCACPFCKNIKFNASAALETNLV